MTSSALPVPLPETVPLTRTGRWLILAVAFVGWLWAGMHMSTTQLTGRAAAIDLLNRTGNLDGERFRSLNERAQSKGKLPALAPEEKVQLKQWESLVGRWFAWFQCAFLFGAAAGGLCFGKLGDWLGRSRAMSASIVTYSVMAGATSLAQSPLQLCGLWFLACTGVGGMWSNGVALVSEVWSRMSRPAIAGIIGTAANVGLFLMATLGTFFPITAEAWRWVVLVGAIPVLLGLFSFAAVPESPRWLASRHQPAAGPAATGSVFRPPLLKITLVAILLGTVPMIGGWGTANWMTPWAEKAGEAADPPDLFLKARVGQARALTGIVGSLLGGWLASRMGRRQSYFWVSFLSLGLAQYIFWFAYPTDPWFLTWVGVLGFLSGIYFGWLPLCLPELFPTRVRSTGAGVGFNFGRIVTAITIFAAGAIMALFDGDYARIGRVTSFLFLLGMIGIWLAPKTSDQLIEE